MLNRIRHVCVLSGLSDCEGEMTDCTTFVDMLDKSNIPYQYNSYFILVVVSVTTKDTFVEFLFSRDGNLQDIRLYTHVDYHSERMVKAGREK
jgi:hypothetical protein